MELQANFLKYVSHKKFAYDMKHNKKSQLQLETFFNTARNQGEIIYSSMQSEQVYKNVKGSLLKPELD